MTRGGCPLPSSDHDDDAVAPGYRRAKECDDPIYALRPWLRFQGRFQFFDYRTLYGGPVDGLGGTFYLGTSLGF